VTKWKASKEELMTQQERKKVACEHIAMDLKVFMCELVELNME
jgi:hypothetical protein